VAGGWSCSKETLTEPVLVGTRVLFIGNSLTYSNDLPATFAAVAKSVDDTVSVVMAAGPDLAIIDHLNGATDAVSLLERFDFDFVVLQQGPTTLAINRDSLILWTQMIDPYIRGAGAKPALFMAWPFASQWERLPLVRQSFQQAAQAVGGIFLPAGEAWRLAREADPSIAVYGPDGYHPSPIGSFLAALTIYERLSGRDARTLPLKAYADGREMSVPLSTIRALQEAAHAANLNYPQ
jgi:hypothetical protein